MMILLTLTFDELGPKHPETLVVLTLAVYAERPMLNL